MNELEDRSYEELIGELTQLVDKMEVGQDSLEKLFDNFETGMTLLNECKRRLNRFNKRIEILNRESGDGEWKEFDVVENNARSEADNLGDLAF